MPNLVLANMTEFHPAERFWNSQAEQWRLNMRGMELHIEVIRDKDAIYTELVQSKTHGYQLAICYSSEGKLVVKICFVTEITRQTDGVMMVTYRGNLNDVTTQGLIPIDGIESIYPIHAFRK